MDKVSISAANSYCPQALFLYGTYKEDGSPNFGLFCWFSYCWDTELGVMACIGGEKLTKDRIRAGRVFSANLVNETLLPAADYLGNTDGYTPGKMDIPLDIERGAVLPVPVLAASPWVFELEVRQSIPLDDSEVFLCKIRNVLADKALLDDSLSVAERMALAAPVLWSGSNHGTYYSLKSEIAGTTGDWKAQFTK